MTRDAIQPVAAEPNSFGSEPAQFLPPSSWPVLAEWLARVQISLRAVDYGMAPQPALVPDFSGVDLPQSRLGRAPSSAWLWCRQHDGPNMMAFYQDGNASPQHVEEHAHPSRVVEAIERAEIFGERALGQPYRVPHLELRSQLQQPVRACRGDERFYNSRRNRMWTVPLHHQSSHPYGASDGAPLIMFGVEDDEHVTREERCHHSGQLAGMPNGLLALGQKCAIALVPELDFGAPFLVRQSMNDEPSLAVGQVGRLTSRKLQRIRLVQHVRLASLDRPHRRSSF